MKYKSVDIKPQVINSKRKKKSNKLTKFEHFDAEYNKRSIQMHDFEFHSKQSYSCRLCSNFRNRRTVITNSHSSNYSKVQYNNINAR